MKMTAAKISFLIGFLMLAALSRTPGQQVGGTIDDKGINVADFEDLTYPAIAVIAHVQGVVVVRVRLSDQGKVLDAVALSGAQLLTGPAIDNAKKWRFEPNSQKAAVIVYNFRIEGICHDGAAASHMIFYPPNFATITDCARPAMP